MALRKLNIFQKYIEELKIWGSETGILLLAFFTFFLLIETQFWTVFNTFLLLSRFFSNKAYCHKIIATHSHPYDRDVIHGRPLKESKN